MIYSINGTNGEIEITLSTEAAQNINDSQCSLVFPFYNNSLVMSYHNKRKGWELPKGHREEGETPEECAKREAFEETGSILNQLKPVGYFKVKNNEGTQKTAIFASKVDRFEPKPNWSETGIVKIFDEIPENISYKDDVYKIALDYIKKNEKEIFRDA